jgi:hypothetical protein
MKMLPVKLTQISAFAALMLALGPSPTPCSAAGNQNYGLPQGTLSVTTPPGATAWDSTQVSWGADTFPTCWNGTTWIAPTKKHNQMRADQTYTAQSDEWYASGVKFDPHGSIGIRRFFQTRTPGTTSLGAPSEINVLTKDMPANSRFNQAQQIQDFGPYAPDQSTFTTNSLAANDVYGVETIELVFIDGSGNQTVLDYQKIDIYQPLSAAVANFYVQNFQQKTALNTSTTANPTSYGGDPPRAIMNTTQTIYPGAETWVVIYSGGAQATPPSGAMQIPSTDATAPGGDAWQRNNVYIDTGNYGNGRGTYTLQVMQKSVYGTEPFGNPASFSITQSYKVNSQLGLVK